MTKGFCVGIRYFVLILIVNRRNELSGDFLGDHCGHESVRRICHGGSGINRLELQFQLVARQLITNALLERGAPHLLNLNQNHEAQQALGGGLLGAGLQALGAGQLLSLLVMPTRSLFIADTYVNHDPDAETLAEVTLLAADAVLRFGIQPKVALLSHSLFGSSEQPGARKMAEAVKILHRRAPSLELDGEMHGDAALDPEIRQNVFPNSRLKGSANLLICPSLDAANIAFNLLKTAADGLHVGPMLLGTALPAHVLTPSVTARGILNMTALSVVEPQRLAETRSGTGFVTIDGAVQGVGAIAAYIHTGGKVGVQMSYVFPCGTKVCHSLTPKNR